MLKRSLVQLLLCSQRQDRQDRQDRQRSDRIGRSVLLTVAQKVNTKKPKHVTSHVFAKTTHVVAASHGFVYVVIPATFIEIRLGATAAQGSKCGFSDYFGYWLLQQLALYVQAVMSCR